MGSAIQSIGRSFPRDIGDLRRPHYAWRAQTYPRYTAAGRTVSNKRADNVQGAFLVPPDHKVEVAGRRLVLVDDVLTSGATVDACTRALLRAGAAQVDVLVFARVVAPARSPI